MSVDVAGAMDETLGFLTLCRLPREGHLSREHLRWMRAEVARWDLGDRSKLEKANRWLGWVQGVATCKGVPTEVLRAINKAHSVAPTPPDVLEIHLTLQETLIEFHPEPTIVLPHEELTQDRHGFVGPAEAPEMCWHTDDPSRRFLDALSLARTLIRARPAEPPRPEARQWIVVLAAAALGAAAVLLVLP